MESIPPVLIIKKMKREITKKVQQLSRTQIGVSLKKEDREILGVKVGSIVKVIKEEPFLVDESELTQEEKEGAIDLGDTFAKDKNSEKHSNTKEERK